MKRYKYLSTNIQRLILTCLCTFICTHAHASNCLTIAYPISIKATESIIPIIREIYENAGLCINFEAMPYTRAKIEMESGQIDGNITRTKSYIKRTEDLAYVEAPIATAQIILFAPKNVIDALNTTQQQDLTIGYLLSDAHARDTAERLTPHNIPIRSYEQLVAMLEMKRIDGFVMDNYSHRYMRKINMLNTKKLKQKTLDTYTIHHVLNGKHHDVITKISPEFTKKAKADIFNKKYNEWIDGQTTFFLMFSTTGSKARFPFTMGLKKDQATLLHKSLELILSDLNVQPKEFSIDVVNRIDSLRSGYVDFIIFSPSWLPNKQPFAGTVFSDPIFDIQDDIVCTAKHAKHIKSHRDLYKTTTGTIAGYKYFDEDLLTRKDYKDEGSLLNAIQSGEVPCGIVGHLSFQKLEVNNNYTLKHAFPHSNGTLNILIDEELKDILNDINKSIAHHKQSGDLDKLLASYTDSAQ
ncbi:MAG: transporter substrate-binding domain-containing protein [Pseudomonadota bacterium]|nr:transporter substrate-binding domain-containing protein [Pseudomonadota bacterium]